MKKTIENRGTHVIVTEHYGHSPDKEDARTRPVMAKYAAAELIDQLRSWAVACPGALPSGLVDDIVAVLEQAERWEGVIEAAGKMDRRPFLSVYTGRNYGGEFTNHEYEESFRAVMAFLSALPEPPEGGKGKISTDSTWKGERVSDLKQPKPEGGRG